MSFLTLYDYGTNMFVKYVQIFAPNVKFGCARIQTAKFYIHLLAHLPTMTKRQVRSHFVTNHSRPKRLTYVRQALDTTVIFIGEERYSFHLERSFCR